VQKKQLQKRPTYAIEAVDNALQLIQLLRDVGSVRLKEAAAELGVAPSTAHRLLSMLVYRGFAVQDESRRYLPGPAMGVGPTDLDWGKQLRLISQPHMELLSTRLNETVNLMIRVGTKVRFLSTVESANILRVGDRQGTVLPAVRASGGKAILAELDPAAVEDLFFTDDADASDDFVAPAGQDAFRQELASIRNNGFAANFEGTEEGISALGVALHNHAGAVVGALSVATPSSRFRSVFDGGLVKVVMAARRNIEADIAANPANVDGGNAD
jgi:IclR family transcriptional regulator, acetate operon repressor